MRDIMEEEIETTVVGFEEKHTISIMLFLSINGECKKIDVYRNVSSNPRIPDKLDRLEAMGLLTQSVTKGSRAVTVKLTPKGRIVADKLIELDKIMRTD